MTSNALSRGQQLRPLGVFRFLTPNVFVYIPSSLPYQSCLHLHCRSSNFDVGAPLEESKKAPFRQLANVCERAKTRYGYIQTDQELVICRFCLEDDEWRVEIMPDPMSRQGLLALTSDLALWWLCMLGLSKEDFKLTIPHETLTIDMWGQVDDGNGSWFWRHVYSQRENAQSP